MTEGDQRVGGVQLQLISLTTCYPICTEKRLKYTISAVPCNYQTLGGGGGGGTEGNVPQKIGSLITLHMVCMVLKKIESGKRDYSASI